MSVFILIPVLLFLTSCAGEKEAENTASGHWEYREEKTQAGEPELPYQDFPAEYGRLCDYSAAENGDVYFLCQMESADGQSRYIYRVFRSAGGEGDYEELPLLPDGEKSYVALVVSPEGEILLLDTQRAYLFRPEGGEAYCDIPAWPSGGIVFPGDGTVICQGYDGSPYYIFDLYTGKSKGEYLDREFLSQGGETHVTFLTKNETGFFLSAKAGIYENVDGEWVLRVPSELKTLSKSGMQPVRIEKGEDESFLVWDSRQNKYRYTLEKVDDDREEIILRVEACAENTFLNNALVDFQIRYPHIVVEYEPVNPLLPETTQEMNTLVQQINARVTSGQAADVYVLDGLPWESYGEKGFLMELSPVAEPYVRQGGYYEDILTGAASEKGLYAVPLYFQTQFVICDKELEPYVKSIYELADYLKAHPEDNGLMYVTGRNRAEIFLPEIYRFYGQDLYEGGDLTRENVTRFLESARVIYERLLENSDGGVDSRYKYNITNASVSLKELYDFMVERQSRILLFPGNVIGLETLPSVFHYEDLSVVPVGRYQPQILVGIREGGDNQENAVLLLQYLLEYYENDGKVNDNSSYCILLPGIPVNKQFIYDRLTETRPERQPGDIYYYPSYGEAFPQYVPTSEDMDTIVKLFETFDSPGKLPDVRIDSVYQILQEHSMAYFYGDLGLEEAAEAVYQGIKLIQEEGR